MMDSLKQWIRARAAELEILFFLFYNIRLPCRDLAPSLTDNATQLTTSSSVGDSAANVALGLKQSEEQAAEVL